MPRHVFVAGSMRSGTTLLGEMLGSADGAVCIGETTLLWRALLADDVCSCGEPASGCPLWSAVVAGLRDAGMGRDALAGLQEDLLEAVRTRRLAGLWRELERAPDRRTPGVASLADALAMVSEAAAARLGAETVVDTTKYAPGLVLRAMATPGPLDVVHVVRDPRGVVASNVRSLSGTARAGEPDARPPVRATLVWAAENVLLAQLGPRVGRYQQVAYESVVSDPASALQGWAATLGLAWPSDLLDGSSFTVRHSHVLVGNPRRLDGPLRHLRLDERWRGDLTPWQQRAVSVAAALPSRLTRAAAGRPRGDGTPAI